MQDKVIHKYVVINGAGRVVVACRKDSKCVQIEETSQDWKLVTCDLCHNHLNANYDYSTQTNTEQPRAGEWD